jgi:IPT/TIG domain-containing protein
MTRRRFLAIAIVILGLIGAYTLNAEWGTLTGQLTAPIAYSLAGLLFVVFWVLFFAALAPSPTDPALGIRRRIFYFNSVLLPLLFVAALVYYKFPFAEKDLWLKTALHGIWFGVLGSVAISFKGISDHPRGDEWDEGWWVWYLQRPFMGAVVGVMTYLILQVADPKNPPSIPALAVAAFVFGTQEQRFFNVLYEAAKLVLGSQLMGGLAIRHVTFVGLTIVITGTGFKAGAKLTVNDAPIANITVSADGTSITAPLLALPTSPVNVVVLNPDGTAAWISFTLPAPPAAAAAPPIAAPPPAAPQAPAPGGATP